MVAARDYDHSYLLATELPLSEAIPIQPYGMASHRRFILPMLKSTSLSRPRPVYSSLLRHATCSGRKNPREGYSPIACTPGLAELMYVWYLPHAVGRMDGRNSMNSLI